MNIWSMALETETKNATQERYATASQASEAYRDFYGYVFYNGDIMEVSEESGWSIMEQNDWCDDEEGYWASIDATRFDSELYWEQILLQGCAY